MLITNILRDKVTMTTTENSQVYQLLAHGRWFSVGTPASSTTKTSRHDITEILLKVALKTKNQSINQSTCCCMLQFNISKHILLFVFCLIYTYFALLKFYFCLSWYCFLQRFSNEHRFTMFFTLDLLTIKHQGQLYITWWKMMEVKIPDNDTPATNANISPRMVTSIQARCVLYVYYKWENIVLLEGNRSSLHYLKLGEVILRFGCSFVRPC